MEEILNRLFPQPQYVSGLLGDESQIALQQARQQGLLGLAAGLLQAGGPSRQRTNIGQAIGAGLQAGQQAYRGALSEQIQGQQMAMKLAEQQRLQQQQRALQGIMPQLMTTERQQALTTGAQAADPLAALIQSAEAGTLDRPVINQQALGQVSSLLPPSALKDLMSALKTRVEISQPPEVKSPFAAIDPSKYTPESVRQFTRTKDYSALRIADPAQQFTGDFANTANVLFGTPDVSQLDPNQRLQVFDAVLRKTTATAAQINMPGETANLLVTRAFLPRVTALNEEAASAQKLATASSTINTILKGAGGGGIVKLSTDVQRFLGLPSDRVTADDLAQALATQTAVGVRASGSGATSDLEFKAYLAAVPSLSRSEEGRAFMADYATRRAKRAALHADFAAKLLKDSNYSELALQEYDEKLGPLIGEDERKEFLPQLTATSARGVAQRSGWITQ